jgi:hypothetical protein
VLRSEGLLKARSVLTSRPEGGVLRSGSRRLERADKAPKAPC